MVSRVGRVREVRALVHRKNGRLFTDLFCGGGRKKRQVRGSSGRARDLSAEGVMAHCVVLMEGMVRLQPEWPWRILQSADEESAVQTEDVNGWARRSHLDLCFGGRRK